MAVVVGDSGTSVTLDTGQDISGAAAAKVVFESPSGTVALRSASKSGNYITYTLQADDIGESGVWKIQGWVSFGATGAWYTKIAEFRAYPRLYEVE